METTDKKSHECSVEELKKRQELEHLLHLEKENAALKHENQQLQEEKQDLLDKNQLLNDIIEQLRDMEKRQSTENILDNQRQYTSAISRYGDAPLSYKSEHHLEIWHQILTNLERQTGDSMLLQHNLALLLAISANEQRQSAMQETENER